MTDQTERARHFASLHQPGRPLILFNAWDAGSARVVAESGALAIATGSWSVAAANSFDDGEQLPRELAVANAARIARAVDLPVSIDLESGYGREPDRVAESARLVWDAGAVGCNLEDGIPGSGGIYAIEEQASRLAAVGSALPDLFVNARTDLFLASAPERHAELLDEATDRARAYAEAGARGFFAPGLGEERLIETLCRASPLPVNIMVWHNTPPVTRLAELGVARVSHAGAPWRVAMDALREAARAALT